jgi:hypothetical protein
VQFAFIGAQRRPLIRRSGRSRRSLSAGRAEVNVQEKSAGSRISRVESEETNTEVLDRLAKQLRVGKNAACPRAIARILTTVKERCERDEYASESALTLVGLLAARKTTDEIL